jgi:peptidoglycan/xylan/chitin deacetylase (PgdA/CDA1 family)
LRERAGVHATSFAYPYGLVDARVREAVQCAGYRAAVTLDYGLNSPSTDPWMLRRVNVPASIPTSAYEAWTAGLRPRWRR